MPCEEHRHLIMSYQWNSVGSDGRGVTVAQASAPGPSTWSGGRRAYVLGKEEDGTPGSEGI